MPPLIRPYWATTDMPPTVRLYLGNVEQVLSRLPAKSVHCVVTSPPYWGLRDYGVEGQIGSEPIPDCGTSGQAQCSRCFVCTMVAVFREVRRVLRDDGTLWLNLGDTYGGGPPGGSSAKQESNSGSFGARAGNGGLPSGNLVGIPWRVVLALQADGWVLRQDVIWNKPSPMPESVRNRCTKAHEYIFLLTKGQRYYYDAEAIKEKAKQPEGEAKTAGIHHKQAALGANGGGTLGTNYGPNSRNKRSVWTVDDERMVLGWLMINYPEIAEAWYRDATNKPDVWRVPSFGYPGAHFATFPPKLIEPCILAGTSEYGCCAGCGAPWSRVVEEKKLIRPRPNDYVKRTGEQGTGNSCANTVAGVEVKTLGWKPTCGCGTDDVRPCTVLDPFVGSGTTCCVALEHGRASVGIDLSEEYLVKNAIPRVEGCLLQVPALRGLVPRAVVKPVMVGKTLLT